MNTGNRLPPLPTVARVQSGEIQVLASRRVGGRGMAILHDKVSGHGFLTTVFYESGDAITRIGTCFGLRHGAQGLDDIVALVTAARAASVA